MSRTYQKGRASKDKRRGFKRTSWTNKCQCSYCSCSSRIKSWKKTKERNEIKSIIDEYYSAKERLVSMETMIFLSPMTL